MTSCCSISGARIAIAARLMRSRPDLFFRCVNVKNSISRWERLVRNIHLTDAHLQLNRQNNRVLMRPFAFSFGLLLPCLLVLSGIEATNSSAIWHDPHHSTERVPTSQDGAGSENESETEKLIGSSSAKRRVHANETRLVFVATRMRVEFPKLIITSLSQSCTSSCELDNRNGVIAPLRC